jgi:hypothetical protein
MSKLGRVNAALAHIEFPLTMIEMYGCFQDGLCNPYYVHVRPTVLESSHQKHLNKRFASSLRAIATAIRNSFKGSPHNFKISALLCQGG